MYMISGLILAYSLYGIVLTTFYSRWLSAEEFQRRSVRVAAGLKIIFFGSVPFSFFTEGLNHPWFWVFLVLMLVYSKIEANTKGRKGPLWLRFDASRQVQLAHCTLLFLSVAVWYAYALQWKYITSSYFMTAMLLSPFLLPSVLFALEGFRLRRSAKGKGQTSSGGAQ